MIITMEDKGVKVTLNLPEFCEVSWRDLVDNFKNMLRAATYIIPYDDEEDDIVDFDS